MAVALKNKERRMQVYNLPHDIYCQAVGECSCQEKTVTTIAENPLTGDRMPKPVRKKLAGSLTLLALEKRDGLHEAVLEIPEVKRAVERGRLKVLTAQPTAARPTSAEPKGRKDKEKK